MAFAQKGRVWEKIALAGGTAVIFGLAGLFVNVALVSSLLNVVILVVMLCGITGGVIGGFKSEPNLFKMARDLGKLPVASDKKAITAGEETK